MSVGRQLLEELRRDEELRRALAEELLPEALRHRELRRAMLVALSREVATKEDVENLRRATKEDIENLGKATKEYIESLGRAIKALEERVSSLEQRVARVEGQLSLLVKAFIAFNLPTLIGIIGILLRTHMPPPPELGRRAPSGHRTPLSARARSSKLTASHPLKI